MELAPAVDAEFDKENVAPPLPKAGSKPTNGALLANAKPSDDDSTDCFIVESSASEQSTRTSPVPGVLSSATLARVEGKQEAEVTADADPGAAASKKKRKKKKKKKKAKSTEAVDTEVAVSSSALDSVVCRDVDMRDTNPEDKHTSLTEPAPEEAPSIACQDVDMRDKETKIEEREESEDTSPMETAAEDVEDLCQKSAAERDASFDNKDNGDDGEGAEEEEEEGETKPRRFDVLDDAAVLAVGRRPLIELGTSSDSDTEHRPFYDEEYVTVDEEAPTPLLSAGHEPEEGEVEEVSPEAVSEHETPFEAPSEEMMTRIVKQMEFYFSDANILKDYFLLRRVRKSKGGWVRVSLLAGFKLVQSITKDIRQIVFALKEKSKLLEIDESGTRVRRKDGLPTWDHHVYKRTCLVYGFEQSRPRRDRPAKKPLTDSVSVQYVREQLFPKFDPRILLVRILKAGKDVPLDLKTCVRNHPQLGHELCVVVEFDTVATAEAARSAVDGRRWSQSHRLWAKILGKRPRLPEEWAARFGAQRAELLKQQHQQHRERQHQLHQHQAYRQELLQQLYYQQQQQKFLEELQRRRWGEKKFSYADSVRGKKRPAPESYADKVRGGKNEATETEAAAAAEGTASTEQRKTTPRVRARAKKSTGEARKVEKKEAPKPKANSYAAAAAAAAPVASSSSGESVTPKDVRRDGATQTTVPEQADKKERFGLQLVREPRGPKEAGSGPCWVRRGAEAGQAIAKGSEAVAKAEAEEINGEAEAEAAMDADADAEAEAMGNEAEEPREPAGRSGLARRRSVRELVRQFEALTATPTEEEASSSPRGQSVTPRGAESPALDGVPEL